MRIYIETKLQTCPVKGMEISHDGHDIRVYRSVNHYPAAVANSIAKSLSFKNGIDAVAVFDN